MNRPPHTSSTIYHSHDRRVVVYLSLLWRMNAIETARYGTVEDLSTLLGSGIDINEPDEVPSPSLPSSIHPSSWRGLLRRLQWGCYAIIDAAREGNYDCLSLLIDTGAIVDTQNTVPFPVLLLYSMTSPSPLVP